MKKSVVILALTTVAGFAFGQTIAVNGTSGTITPGGTFDSTISLTINGANSINNVESLNLLLGTPSTGANSGAGLFSVYVSGISSPFTLTNSPSSSGNQSTFATAGDAANSGHSISTDDTGSRRQRTVTIGRARIQLRNDYVQRGHFALHRLERDRSRRLRFLRHQRRSI